MKMETLKKEKNNKRRNILIVLAILILLLVFIGVTYSFYSARVKFVNKSQTIIKTNEVSLVYTGVKEITTGNSMIPGDSFTKTFTVENTSDTKTTYNIYMEEITNEFNEDLVFVLTDDNGEVVTETPLPATNTGKSYLLKDIEIDGGELQSYTLKIEFKYLDTPQNDYQGKNFKATVGIDANQVESMIPELACKATKCLDNDRSGDISVGDLITYDTESFYVYSTGTDIKMFAEYNLEVGNSTNSAYPPTTETNLQSSKAIGNVTESQYATIAFSSDDIKGANYSDYEGSIVQSYVNTYATKLTEKGCDAKEVTLITKEELDILGCNYDESKCNNAPSFVYNTSYWTRSAFNENNIYFVSRSGYYYNNTYNINAHYGVRPVVVISAENL